MSAEQAEAAGKKNNEMAQAAIACREAEERRAPQPDEGACPPPHSHSDYRKPKPVWGGFGYQVNACPGDKIEVAAALTVSASKLQGVLKIPQTLPWPVDLSGLAPDQIEYLRAHCEADLPCAAHFKVSVLGLERPPLILAPGEWREGDMACSKDHFGTKGCHSSGAEQVSATLDGFRP
jgi:hypothetical protein